MSPDGITLDWRDHRVNRKPKLCRVCRQPAYMTDETGTPCHKVCAEREIGVGGA